MPNEASQSLIFYLPVQGHLPLKIYSDDNGPFAQVLEAELTDKNSEIRSAAQNENALLLSNVAPMPLDMSAELILEKLIALEERAKASENLKLVVLSHFEVFGEREGLIIEGAPDSPAYPRQSRMGKAAWSLSNEREALNALLAEAQMRIQSADGISRRQEAQKENRKARKEPSRGTSFADALVKDAALEKTAWLKNKTLERAKLWGFHSSRGYFCALLEQLSVQLREDATIVRLPPLGPALKNDFYIQKMRTLQKGAGQIALYDVEHALLSKAQRLDLNKNDLVWLCPVDKAAAGIGVALQASFSGKLAGICHLTIEDTPIEKGRKPVAFTAHRLADLLDLAHRSPSYFLKKSRISAAGLVPLAKEWGQRSREHIDLQNEAPLAKHAPLLVKTSFKQMSKLAGSLPKIGKNAALLVDKGGKSIHEKIQPHAPKRALPGGFTSENTRLHSRKLKRLGFENQISLRRYLLDVLVPTLLPFVQEDVRVKHRRTPLAAYSTLLELIEELSEREGTRPALTLLKGNNVVTIRYQDLKRRAQAIASRLQEMKIQKGDRILLSGQNHPDWALLAFGVAFAGAILIPIDPALDDNALQNIIKKARPKLALLDKAAQKKWLPIIDNMQLPMRDLHLFSADGPAHAYKDVSVASSDVASILFTSGTTGEPKGVMLSHRNFTSQLSSLGTVFDMQGEDRSLSLLPLHHTLEYSCGLLLPLSAGAEIHYLDELTADRLVYGLQSAKITGMVGVPALWQLLERKIRKQIETQSEYIQDAFALALSFNQKLGEKTGKDLGRLLFKPVHDELGGHLRTLISGGAALPPEVHALFQGLGLHLAEGYGLTETAPVLTVAEGKPGASSGTVGQAIPGVKLRILDENEQGIGEVVAKAPNVMLGYFENEAATAQVMTEDGWFRTGDLGRFDNVGNLLIVGRAKDVVVTSAGENIYLDDVEATLGALPYVEEYSLLGIADPRGGERLAIALYAKKALRAQAEQALPKALFKVPEVYRPQVVVFFAEALPRTATRKIKRKAVVPLVEAAQKEREQAARKEDTQALTPVRQAVALIATVDVKDLYGATDLRADLGFDSLMWVELQDALFKAADVSLDAEALFACRTLTDLEKLVAQQTGTTAATPRTKNKTDATVDDAPFWKVPRPLAIPIRKALSVGQRELYQSLFTTEVSGRANIPFNRPTIVVANHSSHLDTGLIKFALGRYGNDLAPLAAKDYFFEGNRLKVSLVENFTNLVPIERESGSGKAFEQAKAAIALGKVVLIFPEGTRRADGTLGDFKPLVARLALACNIDILPLHLFGAYDALPRGASFPKQRELAVRIGAPLCVNDLNRLTIDLSAVEQARKSAALARRAVAALRDGEHFDLADFHTLEDAFTINTALSTRDGHSCLVDTAFGGAPSGLSKS